MLKDLLKFEEVSNFVLDGSFYGRLYGIAQKYNLPQERVDELLDLTDAVTEGKIPIADMPAFLEKAFWLEKEPSVQLAIDLAGFRILPLDDFLEMDVAAQIVAWGGDPKKYPPLRIRDKSKTPEGNVEDMVKELGLDLPEYLMKRFSYLATSYLSGEKSRESVMKLIVRPINIGGLAFNEEMMTRLFKMLDERKSNIKPSKLDTVPVIEAPVVEPVNVEAAEPEKTAEPEKVELAKEEKFLSKEEILKALLADEMVHEAQKPVPQRPKSAKREGSGSALALAQTHAIATSVPIINAPHHDDDLRKEIRHHASKLEKVGVNKRADEHTEILRKTAELIGEIVYWSLDGEKLTIIQLADLAEKFLRGVREEHQLVRDLKEKHGFNDADAERVVSIFKRGAEESNVLGAIPQPVKPSSDVDLRKAEKEILDRRLAKLTKKVSDEDINVVLPNARVSAARTKAEELEVQKKKVGEADLIVAEQASKPVRAQARLSAKSAPPAKKTGRPLTDVSYEKRLAGPADELRMMGVQEFRRLSSDPEVSARKILDRLDMLQATSYEERMKGVKAWRMSPLNRLYVSMAQEAIREKVSVSEIASRRRNAGEESLSPAEVKAVLLINRTVAL